MTTPSEKVRPVARLGAHEGRLTGDYAEEAVSYFYKYRVDHQRHLFEPVMTYNLAHVVMLAEQGILDPDRARKLLAALQEVNDLGLDGIELDYKLEGIYPNTEALVIDRTGYNVGGMLYLGRARADAHKVPHRMWLRGAVLDLLAEVIEIRRGALDLAVQHVETLMPCYTHLQHAQPMTFGFYLVSFAEALEAEGERVIDLYRRLNMSPGEVGVGTTTSFPVNRERVAELLGFDGVIDNALFAHRGMDRDIELLAVVAMVALDLYRLCEDFLVWCASDVGFMELDDTHSATSFMMAQKKNPIGLHHTETSWIIAHRSLLALFEIAMRNTSEVSLWASHAPSTCHEALQSVLAATRLMKRIIPAVVVHRDTMRDAVGRKFAQGTDLADMLVRETGISFREAHRVVGTLVRHAVARSMDPSDVTVDMLQAAAGEALDRPVTLRPESLRRALDPMAGVRARTVLGGTAPEAVEAAIGRKRAILTAHEQWLAEKRERLQEADQKLAAACAAILGAS